MATTLEGWQTPIYLDFLTIYRQDERDRDANGKSTGLRVVFSDEKCKKHDTDNYDSDLSPAGQSKMNNLDTSDRVDCHITPDVRAEDVAKLVTSDGRTEYFKVAGAPKHRTLLNYQRFYMTTTTAPKIASGVWNV